MISIAYHTLGCKVNQYETEKIRESLESAGFATVPFGSAADVYVINTCSVTSVADAKSRASVRRALKMNPNAFVVVAGCYAEIAPDEILAIEGVDLVVPNSDKDTIAERIASRFAKQSSDTQCRTPNDRSCRPRLRTRAVVKVQDGCNQFCSYCIIPHARSSMVSRSMEDTLVEIRSLAEFGYKEIVLTGIRLGSYSGEQDGERLPELIRAASKVDGIERIRLSSIEPWEVNGTLLEAMQSPKVCRHLHIPLQSGDDDTLKGMNRPYTSEKYRAIISNVRASIPGIGITTDVIVGFPGETDEAFENTRSLIRELGFSRLHVFRYSARSRTKAAVMPDQVSADIKKTRAEILTELGITAMRRFAASLEGQTLKVLVETQSKTPNHLTGFTDNYVETRFPGQPALRGQIVPVRITGVDGHCATGVMR